jgi:hypothetical protein
MIFNKISDFYTSFRNEIKIQFLFYFNKILKRDLDLKFISLNDVIITKGTEIGIYWEVRGCHKIIIENKVTIPGNSNGFNFIHDGTYDSIFITFYGINRIESKTVPLKSNCINLLNRFEHDICIDSITYIPLNKQNYYNNIPNDWKLVYKINQFKPDEIIIKNNIILKYNIKEVQLDSFIIDNYKPKIKS